MERRLSGADEVVVELLDPRLVRHRGVRERPARGRLGPVLAALAVYEVEPLGLVVPGLVRLVLVAPEDGLAVPVVRLAAQVVTALEQEDPLAGRREPVSERAAAGAGA